MNDIIAFVHAKSTSSRLKNKNKLLLGDIPLFCHAIKNGIDSKLINKVIIDSDSDKILEIGKRFGAVPLKRPKSLATNATTGDGLMYWQASNYPNSKIILQLVPTSPFIKSITIDKAITEIIDKNIDSVIGVRSEAFYEWKNGIPIYYKKDENIPNSFEIKKTTYETTGLYISKSIFVLKEKKRINSLSCSLYELSKIEAIDINDFEEFEFAKIVYKGM